MGNISRAAGRGFLVTFLALCSVSPSFGQYASGTLLLGGSATLNFVGLSGGTLQLSAGNVFAGGYSRVLNVGGGTVTLDRTASSALSIIGGTLTLGGSGVTNSPSFSPINIASDGEITVPAHVRGRVTLATERRSTLGNVKINSGGKLTIGAGAPYDARLIKLVVSSLDIAGARGAPRGGLDVADNPVLITSEDAGLLQELRAMLRAGALGGKGIGNSMLQPGEALGYAQASSASDPNEGVIILPLGAGDADLNSFVSKPDYYAVTRSFGQSDAFWTGGDFNYDGVVDTIDYNAMIANLSPKSAREIVADMAAASASPAGAGVPTPEPSVAAAFAIVSSTLALRRRNSKSLAFGA